MTNICQIKQREQCANHVAPLATDISWLSISDGQSLLPNAELVPEEISMDGKRWIFDDFALSRQIAKSPFTLLLVDPWPPGAAIQEHLGQQWKGGNRRSPPLLMEIPSVHGDFVLVQSPWDP